MCAVESWSDGRRLSCGDNSGFGSRLRGGLSEPCGRQFRIVLSGVKRCSRSRLVLRNGPSNSGTAMREFASPGEVRSDAGMLG